MTNKFTKKLALLPNQPGVYFHKDYKNQIIYVGKAANLKNRVKQYFQKSSLRDSKTEALIRDIVDTDWMIVDSEIDALFLEAEMIKRYKPKYNILLRDDKSSVFVRINLKSEYPTVTLTRTPFDDQSEYFGPYLSSLNLKKALRILRTIFPYAISHNSNLNRVSLDYHLGLDPGLEEHKTSLTDYKRNLRQLIKVLKGQRSNILKELSKTMERLSSQMKYEEALKVRNQLQALKGLDTQIIFSDREFMDLSRDHALTEIKTLFKLNQIPKRIEGYDISHMAGSDVVSSMVVFINGLSERTSYRKFKIKIDKNDDFANMNETLKRRLRKDNISKNPLPDLVIIDGGKGQLDAALKARNEAGLNIIFVGLAKKREEIIIDKNRSNINLDLNYLKKLGGYYKQTDNYISLDVPNDANIIKLFQRIRDESHRFAISYHSILKVKRQTRSSLDDIYGIGPKTRKIILKEVGSIKDIKPEDYLKLQKLIGLKKTSILKNALSTKERTK